MNSKIIVVTGANRGIGFEIARQLARAGAKVILTARQVKAGKTAVASLKAEGLNTDFHPLEVTKEKSVAALREFLSQSPGRLDVLINNAGIIEPADRDVLKVSLETVLGTLETNTLAPLRLAQALAPLLRKSKNGRIINLSSGMGALSGMDSDHAAYRLSKTALNAVTAMLAAAFADEKLAVNSVCPGWVRTDMGGPNAEREVAQGAASAVWLALEAPQSLTGKFIRDRKEIPW
jgi:NAD(P)-dependent dehydrogenase (short-subunit alcohol dehydrogenase family)